jgi:hypothetical protein
MKRSGCRFRRIHSFQIPLSSSSSSSSSFFFSLRLFFFSLFRFSLRFSHFNDPPTHPLSSPPKLSPPTDNPPSGSLSDFFFRLSLPLSRLHLLPIFSIDFFFFLPLTLLSLSLSIFFLSLVCIFFEVEE